MKKHAHSTHLVAWRVLLHSSAGISCNCKLHSIHRVGIWTQDVEMTQSQTNLAWFQPPWKATTSFPQIVSLPIFLFPNIPIMPHPCFECTKLPSLWVCWDVHAGDFHVLNSSSSGCEMEGPLSTWPLSFCRMWWTWLCLRYLCKGKNSLKHANDAVERHSKRISKCHRS